MHNLTENISSKIAFNLCKSKDKTSEEFAVLKYGAFAVVHITMAIILTVLFGILTNSLFEICIISISAALIKKYSGGAHCTGANRCVITGIIVSYSFVQIGSNVINLQTQNIYIIELLILIHSFIILYKKCPVGSRQKPLKKQDTIKKLRKKAFYIYSICIVLFILNILINLNSLVLYLILGLYMQILSLTYMGQTIILFLDKVLLKLKI